MIMPEENLLESDVHELELPEEECVTEVCICFSYNIPLNEKFIVPAGYMFQETPYSQLIPSDTDEHEQGNVDNTTVYFLAVLIVSVISKFWVSL